tara:strand:+ start:1464 stop:1739 length:276 start_codon:yes stop_codon:yes gene_type:complete
MLLTTEQSNYLVNFFIGEAEHNRELAVEDAELSEMYISDAEQCEAVITKLLTDSTLANAKSLVRAFDTYEDLLYKMSEYDERDDIVNLLVA